LRRCGVRKSGFRYLCASSGEIVAVNDALSDSPELVNSEPYAGGWIFKIKASDEGRSGLDATAYEAYWETNKFCRMALRLSAYGLYVGPVSASASGN
jgi:hypothetical protein